MIYAKCFIIAEEIELVANAVGTYCERSRNPKDVVRTQCSLLGRGMNIVEAWYSRDHNPMVVARTY